MDKYIIKIKPETLFLSQHIGDGKLGKDKFDLSARSPSGSLVVEFKDTKKKEGTISEYRYQLNSEQFIRDCHEQYLKDKKK